MDTLKYITEEIKRMSWEQLHKLSSDTGLHINTLYHIRVGKADSPRFKTVMKIKEALEKTQ